jgi:hypothetical protein
MRKIFPKLFKFFLNCLSKDPALTSQPGIYPNSLLGLRFYSGWTDYGLKFLTHDTSLLALIPPVAALLNAKPGIYFLFRWASEREKIVSGGLV